VAKSGDSIRLSEGGQLQLGRELGRGGEGAVFEVFGRANCVAKMYTKPISTAKADKLRVLTALKDPKLVQVAAWPLSLVDGGGGRPIGFVMPSLAEFKPLHALYSPSSRKQQFPGADWSFLVHAATNLSAAFATLHGAGVVIGDVNENLGFIHPKSGLVRLIDADSMQVQQDGRTLMCEVGVPIFTPPELHYSDAFGKEVRTQQHDAFGLAVLLFHLLYFGRHPYAGVPTVSDDLPIEKAIPGFHYAYRADRRSTSLKPPPGAIPISVAGSEVVGLFDRAFAPGRPTRPSPQEWHTALQSLGNRMKRCEDEGAHVFASHMSTCPWCIVEEKAGLFLFISRVASDAIGAARFNLQAIWAAIDAIPRPQPINLDAILAPPVVMTPLAFGDRAQLNWQNHSGAIALASAGCLSFVWPESWLLWLMLCFGLRAILPSKPPKEILKRRLLVIDLSEKLDSLKKDFQKVATEGRFGIRLKRLKELRTHYESLPGEYQRSMTTLQGKVRDAQMQRHLGQFSIRSAKIVGVGDSRKEMLRSFGLDTAADLDLALIAQVKGFGPKLISALLDWRRSHERSFVFDPKRGVDPQDVSRLNRDTETKTRRLETEIRSEANALQQVAQEIELQRNRLLPLIREATHALAQARIDAAL